MSDKFSSKIGFLLAAVGSSIGLGSIWRFPYMVSDNGHGAFIVMYLVCVGLIGIPLILAEYAIGREAARKALSCGIVSIWKVHSTSKWSHLLSYIFVLTSWLIYTYYMVICGWIFIYFYKSLTGGILYTRSDMAYYENLLNSMLANDFQVILATTLALIITGVIGIRGISKGIEKLSIVGMPLLFIILIVIVIRVVTLDGSFDGLKSYLHISSSDFTLKRFLTALGQAFFTLSVGLGILITYASYVKEDNNLLNTAASTAFITSTVSILAGSMIIPSLFIFGFNNMGGPGLIFVSLPAVFSHIYLGEVFAILFFALVIVATLTSTISLLEVVTPVVMNLFKVSRLVSVIFISCVTLCASVLQILSFNVLNHITIFSKNIFTFTDFCASNILMPVGAIIICLYLGFTVKSSIVSDLKYYDKRQWLTKFKVYEIWFFWLKYIIPVLIFVILVLSFKS